MNFAAGLYYGGSLSSLVNFSRSSSGLAQYASGTWASFANNVPRITDQGFLIEEARTNKCTNYNANPPALVTPTTAAAFNAAVTNMTASGGDGTTLWGVVDDSASVTTAGLQNVTNGRVYKIDNSAGAVLATITISGSTGNLNTHIGSAYAKYSGTSSGSNRLRYGSGTVGSVQINTTTYSRFSFSVTPGGVGAALTVDAAPGAIVYFTLNVSEEGSFVTSPIVIAGSSSQRFADIALMSSAASTISLGSVGWAVAQTKLGTYVASGFIFGGSGSSDYYLRQGSGGATTVQGRMGGATNTAATIGGGGSFGSSLIKSGISWNTSQFVLAANNGTTATLAQAPVIPAGVYLGGRNGANMSSYYFPRLTLGTGDIGTGIGALTA